MERREGLITIGGNPFTLVGNPVKVGDKAPNFTVVDNDLKLVEFSDYKGKIVIIAAVGSLDTGVCDIETRRFNSEAAHLEGVTILTISMDLPFAQKRWCGAQGVDRVVTLSDHKDASFGLAYGVLVEEVRLLARSVFVVDREGVIRYMEIVKELSDEPDYNGVLKAAHELTQG